MIVVAPSPSPTLSSFTVNVIAVGAPSSSVIVPVPVAVPIVAFAALLNVATTVSFDSFRTSPVTDTSKVWLVVPAANVSVPPVMAV